MFNGEKNCNYHKLVWRFTLDETWSLLVEKGVGVWVAVEGWKEDYLKPDGKWYRHIVGFSSWTYKELSRE